MLVYSATEARANFSDLINKVKYQNITVAIGRNNKAEVIVSPISSKGNIPITEINSKSSSFDFLRDEPDIYSLDDIQEEYA